MNRCDVSGDVAECTDLLGRCEYNAFGKYCEYQTSDHACLNLAAIRAAIKAEEGKENE